MAVVTESLVDRARRRRAELGLGTPKAEPVTYDEDLIPDVGLGSRTPEDGEIDQALSGVDIIDAYQRWCGKMVPQVGNRTESIMVSCPVPGHRDANPSAWVNLDKGVGHCAVCAQGFDKYDIAAWHFGFGVPDYKGSQFPALRRRMAEDLGYTVKRTVGGQEYVERPAEPVTASVDVEQGAGGTAVVAPDILPNVSEPEPETETEFVPVAAEDLPTIDWQSIIPGDTFLFNWMKAVTADDLPEEYYFWLGLVAVGMAVGDAVWLADNPIVKSNLFICLFGPSGIGKSRSIRALVQVLREALPYDYSTPDSTGAYIAPSPGSAEALLDAFSRPIHDPSDNKTVVGYGKVRGLVQFDELSALAARSSRMGSALKPTLMQLYDGYQSIELRSRGTGLVKAESPFCSTLTTTQPKAVHSLLEENDANSGFLNRWIFAMGRPKPLVAFARHELDLHLAVKPLSAIHTWGSSKRKVDLDRDALAAWTKFFTRNIQPIRTSEEDALLTRVDLTLKKIMLLLAINDKTTTITTGHVERAISVFPYLENTFSVLFGAMGSGSPFNECQALLLRKIREFKRSDGPSSRDLSRLVPAKFPRDLVQRALKNMVDFGMVTETLHRPSRGPATTRYTYVAD